MSNSKKLNMKSLITICGVMLVALMIFTGCGGGISEIAVDLKTKDVKGDLSEYFKVADGSYKLLRTGKEANIDGKYLYQIKVQVKRTEKKFSFNSVDLAKEDLFKIICSLYDVKEVPVITAALEGFNEQGSNSEDAALAALKPSETGWAIFSFWGDKETMNKVKNIQVGSYLKLGQDENNTATSSGKTENDTTSDKVDCDQFFNDYKAFVNSYIKLLKKYKANPTNPTILNEYTEAAQKATEMQSNASSCTDPKYVSKLIELNNKLAQAAL